MSFNKTCVKTPKGNELIPMLDMSIIRLKFSILSKTKINWLMYSKTKIVKEVKVSTLRVKSLKTETKTRGRKLLSRPWM